MTPDPATQSAGAVSSQKPVTPRLYVACLAAYNNGRLHGAWVDATDGPDAVYAAISAMLKASPIPNAEEWAIHDYEGFGELRLDEYCSVERACALADFIAEHGALGTKLLAYHDEDLEAARAALEESAGTYDSVADFARSLTEDTGDIPKHLAPYIDYEAMARDLVMGGDIYALELEPGRVHIFWAR